MNQLSDHLHQLLKTPEGVVSLAASLVISLCVTVVFAAVLVNFIACHRADGVKQERKSVVATGTMTMFFLFFYGLIRFQVGDVSVGNVSVRMAMAGIGLAIIVFGCFVNVAGRLRLGRNWANQATIYEQQGLVMTGVYGWVRHPLYASIIWMFYGASLVYANLAAFWANTLVFLPFMVYRARLEEALLAKEFKEYGEYKCRVGMFFWKLFPTCHASIEKEG